MYELSSGRDPGLRSLCQPQCPRWLWAGHAFRRKLTRTDGRVVAMGRFSGAPCPSPLQPAQSGERAPSQTQLGTLPTSILCQLCASSY